MIVIPAVDIMNHNVVQLVGGKPGTEIVNMPDPFAVAMSWVDKGAKYLHIVDLDGAFGNENNDAVIVKIIKEAGVPVEVGGGIRDEKRIKKLAKAGADRIIVGTKALNDFEWFSDMADQFPNTIAMALDTKNGKITQKGWQEESDLPLDTVFDKIAGLPLSGVLNTNVDVEGQGKGIDREFATEFIRKCPHDVIASGGVTTLDDLKILSKAGAVGAVVGVSIYTGKLNPSKLREPWMC